MSRLTSSTVLPFSFAVNSVLLFNRSVQKRPGSRLLIVTLCATVARARPATKPVRPLRAPFDNASSAIGAFTALEVMLTIRPKRLEIIGGFLQRLALARDEGDAAAFASQRRCAPPTEPLACAAYERGLAANFKIHDFSERKFVFGLARRADDKIISCSAPEPRPRRS